MKLFGHPDSGHALKVKFFLEWSGAEHEYEYVDIFAERSTRSSEFLNSSRFAEVPTLLDNGQAYTQSNAILVYLGKKFGLLKQEDEQTCFEWLVWEANKIGLCLPQLQGHEKFAEQFPNFQLNSGAYSWLMKRYVHDVGVLDRELSEKPFILGKQVSIADFSLCAYLMYADEAKVDVPANVGNWLQRMQNLKGWASPYEMLKGSR